MKWFRKHIKTGSRLALLALAVQFVLSFGHFHAATAQAAPAIKIAQAQADFAATVGTAAVDAASQLAEKQPPPNQDNDQRPADGCAICAVIALMNSMLFATPPALLLPQAIELLHLTTDAGFEHLNSAHSAFNSRAPPLS
jgi:hypothetical protein